MAIIGWQKKTETTIQHTSFFVDEYDRQIIPYSFTHTQQQGSLLLLGPLLSHSYYIIISGLAPSYHHDNNNPPSYHNTIILSHHSITFFFSTTTTLSLYFHIFYPYLRLTLETKVTSHFQASTQPFIGNFLKVWYGRGALKLQHSDFCRQRFPSCCYFFQKKVLVLMNQASRTLLLA